MSTLEVMRARIDELIRERNAVEKREYEAQGVINALRAQNAELLTVLKAVARTEAGKMALGQCGIVADAVIAKFNTPK